MTQGQAAQQLGVTRPALSGWERGGPVPPDRVPQLAQLYGVPEAPLRRWIAEQEAKRRAAELPSQPVRTFLAETRLELVKGGASEEEIEEAMELLTAPQVRSYFMGGARRDRSEEDVLKGMRALVDAVIKPRLRELGRKV